jgi:NTE family protein
MSGCSGGAICAFLAWGALVRAKRGLGLSRSLGSLESFWSSNAAHTPWERAWNDWLGALRNLQQNGTVPELRVSPYAPASGAFEELLARAVPRPEFFDLRLLLGAHAPTELLGRAITEPRLLVSAVDVLSGEFRVFDSCAGEITLEAILASSALPTMFRAQRIGEGLYWDGLMSQNPPLHELVSVPRASVKPDELWVVRIIPRTRTREPKSCQEIEDRRNELAGSLSLERGLRCIGRVNRWLQEGSLNNLRYKEIQVRIIDIDPELTAGLDLGSKSNRSSTLISRLFEQGQKRGAHFADSLPADPAASHRRRSSRLMP